MTLVALVIIPLSMITVMLIVKHSQKYFKQQQEYLGHVNGHVEEMYGGHIVMKAFNGEEESIQKFDVSNNTLYDAAWKVPVPLRPDDADHDLHRQPGLCGSCRPGRLPGAIGVDHRR